MKFFTPDLLERFASEDNRIALSAHEELETRSAQYIEHLESIAKKLPPRFLELQDNYYLHDAKVIPSFFPWLDPIVLKLGPSEPWIEWFMMHSEIPERFGFPSPFLLILQLDAPPHILLVMHYRFARIHALSQYPALHEKLPFLEWQHDEVSLEQHDGQPEFIHSILFTNGFELSIRFRDFDFATLKPLSHPLSAPTRSLGQM